MSRLPRLALGTVQPDADRRAMCWAVLELLRRDGLQVQSFLTQSWCAEDQAALAAGSATSRHLDSWLMSPEVAREVFLHGAGDCDFALVEGQFFQAAPVCRRERGRLEPLCEWLDLPAVAILDVAGLGDCRLPPRPHRADGLLLAGVSSGQAERTSANLESLWGIPVIGVLEESAGLRDAVRNVPPGQRPTPGLCRDLGIALGHHWQARRMRRLVSRRELMVRPAQVFRPVSRPRPTVIALAYDEAFNGYFPDTLDLLELCGATIVDFSPLRDERLPAATDVVFLGGGRPDRHVDDLAANACLKLALRDHVRNRGRIYAEAGGMAYLCQHLDTGDGRRAPMVGLLPAVARFDAQASTPDPVEFTLRRSTWFGDAGARIRGYRNARWQLEPTSETANCVVEAGCSDDLVEVSQVIGGRLHLNFAAQRELLSGFFRPQRAPASVFSPGPTIS